MVLCCRNGVALSCLSSGAAMGLYSRRGPGGGVGTSGGGGGGYVVGRVLGYPGMENGDADIDQLREILRRRKVRIAPGSAGS